MVATTGTSSPGFILRPCSTYRITGFTFTTLNMQHAAVLPAVLPRFYQFRSGVTTELIMADSSQWEFHTFNGGWEVHAPLAAPLWNGVSSSQFPTTVFCWQGASTDSNDAIAQKGISTSTPFSRPGMGYVDRVRDTLTTDPVATNWAPSTLEHNPFGLDVHYDLAMLSPDGSLGNTETVDYSVGVVCLTQAGVANQCLQPGTYRATFTLEHRVTLGTSQGDRVRACLFATNNCGKFTVLTPPGGISATSLQPCSTMLLRLIGGGPVNGCSQPVLDYFDTKTLVCCSPLVENLTGVYESNNTVDVCKIERTFEFTSSEQFELLEIYAMATGLVAQPNVAYSLDISPVQSWVTVSEPSTPKHVPAQPLRRYGIEPNPGPCQIAVPAMRSWLSKVEACDLAKHSQRAVLYYQFLSAIVNETKDKHQEYFHIPDADYHAVYRFCDLKSVHVADIQEFLETVKHFCLLTSHPFKVDLTRYGIEANPGPVVRCVPVADLFAWLKKADRVNTSYFAARRNLLSQLERILVYHDECPAGHVELGAEAKRAIWSYLTSRNSAVTDDSRLAYMATLEELLQLLPSTRPPSPASGVALTRHGDDNGSEPPSPTSPRHSVT